MGRRAGMMSALVVLAAGAVSGVAQGNWHVSGTLPTGGEGGWDYVTVDAGSQRLFVTRTTHTQVIDGVTGKVLGDIAGQKGSHGVAIVPAVNRGFITDGGGSGSIVVFDLTSYQVLGKLAAMPDADGIIYDPGTDLVLAVSGDGNALMRWKPSIDVATGKVDVLKLGGAPEFLAVDGKGKAYINLEDKDEVAVVDLKAGTVTAKWSVAPGGHPVGMAIDAAGRKLLIGCRNPQKLVVMSADTGQVEASLPIGVGVDATGFLGGEAFASCRDGSLTVAGMKAGSYAVTGTVKTPEGARTLGVDVLHGRIYLPTAEFEPATSGRPRAKAGTFKLVVVSR